MKSIILQIAALGLGVFIGLSMSTSAHTPCDDYSPPERCRYVQVVDPYSGQLKTEYVCH